MKVGCDRLRGFRADRTGKPRGLRGCDETGGLGFNATHPPRLLAINIHACTGAKKFLPDLLRAPVAVVNPSARETFTASLARFLAVYDFFNHMFFVVDCVYRLKELCFAT